VLAALRACAAKAGQQRVKLALEPINRYETDLVNTVSEGLDLIGKVGMDSLGLLLDTFHMNIEELLLSKVFDWPGSIFSMFILPIPTVGTPAPATWIFKASLRCCVKSATTAFFPPRFCLCRMRMPLPKKPSRRCGPF
jgi:hypothetical protein